MTGTVIGVAKAGRDDDVGTVHQGVREPSGRPGARLAAALGIRMAKDALLDLLRSVPQPPVGTVRSLGVDDFALRKGDSYATILVDLEARRPVDVLPGPDSEPLAAWLRRHPEVEVICRDRAGSYEEGARTGAPQALQVADAWHLWRNIAEAVERTVGSHHGCIRAALAETLVTAEETVRDPVVPEPSEAVAVPFVPPDGLLDVMGRPRGLVARTAERFAAVQALLAKGQSLAAIGRTLRLDHSTVRRFARAGNLEELLVKATGRLSVLDEHKPYQPSHSLVNGLRRDFDAATAGLSTSWSSGQVEGHVTRAKLLKRMAYGRANLDLLRQRVLLGP
ncbi:ISL3 family transposase [Streptomyces sp. WMMC940]|uniref:ISL3 family transposase n=1 Tax=Streptomyces sp. WMMC940 TaxID=3015153 RepID=UPI0022B6C3D3|nr:ISL3 family transposase [Streptomyces sp. WMMC940]MCZ7462280.1 ISL3 family transposase [Streptomyces sp. WMMC940]